MRSLIAIAVVVALSATLLAIPEIRVFGVERGEPENVLGLTLGLDLQGGTHLVYQLVPREGRELTQEDADAIRTIIDQRVNEFGVSEATVQLLGGGGTGVPDRILVQIPGQTGASLTIQFSQNTVGPGQLETFFREDLGKSNATVTRNDDGSLTVEFDELRPPELDSEGNVVEPGEAEGFRDEIEQRFPAQMIVAFNPPSDEPEATATPDATATPEPTATPTPEEEAAEDLPTLEEVEAAFAAAGRPDVVVTETENAGVFTVEIAGPRPERTDDEGNPIPSDEALIRDELEEIGSLAQVLTFGQITRYTPGGGVEEAKELIGSTAQLEFRERICGTEQPEGMSDSQWLQVRCTDPQYYEEVATSIDASDLTNAFAGTVQGVSGPVVNIEFNDAGAEAFFEVTDRISRTGDLLAVYLDGRELVAPSADQGISGGRAFISGNFTAERARTVAIQLRSGALPTDLSLIQERNVDATLGEESLQKSLVAGGVGLALLLVFMIAYYKVPGLVASFMLVLYTIVLLAIFKMIPVTLTLSGAAALILTLGFAVDANILISERIKEELRTGRTLLAAIDAGFSRAWTSIRDGNLSTIIVALVLFWFGDRFGTSIMQGFALTLAIGVLLSMLTAFVANRVFLRLAARSALGRRMSLFTPVVDTARDEPAAGG